MAALPVDQPVDLPAEVCRRYWPTSATSRRPRFASSRPTNHLTWTAAGTLESSGPEVPGTRQPAGPQFRHRWRRSG